MNNLDERLKLLKEKIEQGDITIMIMGLGSVGQYLLDYIISKNDPSVHVVAVGRNAEKMEPDVNIVRVSALIRNQNKSAVSIESGCDFNNISDICECIKKYTPDFIVNTSRVYPGLKYGSISWHNFRAYGIWSPLAINLIRNIMSACDMADTNAVVINASYSDAVIPWLRSAEHPYPDFGSGNLNHLIPRIKFAAAQMSGIKDYWNIEVMLATAHFHDVVISKEGQTEGQNPLLALNYKGKPLVLNETELYRLCKISMPVDAKRNMMNASSNFDIVFSIIDALRENSSKIFHSPGALGLPGGYPVRLDGKENPPKAVIDESVFTLADMLTVNKKSLALDGIESIENGTLIYTDILLEKVKKAFSVDLPKRVAFTEIDTVAEFIIENIIKRAK
ncbi:MAG: hypothetical protein LBI14_00530 [Treponema sp.]|jgi:hypothetical protein|nr:hypothetical protein [Treponema sp.]